VPRLELRVPPIALSVPEARRAFAAWLESLGFLSSTLFAVGGRAQPSCCHRRARTRDPCAAVLGLCDFVGGGRFNREHLVVCGRRPEASSARRSLVATTQSEKSV
jgi:hypothetical protein